MKLYRAKFRCERYEQQGYQWFGTQAEAKAAVVGYVRDLREEGVQTQGKSLADWEVVEFDVKKPDILAAFRRYASHPNNG